MGLEAARVVALAQAAESFAGVRVCTAAQAAQAAIAELTTVSTGTHAQVATDAVGAHVFRAVRDAETRARCHLEALCGLEPGASARPEVLARLRRRRGRGVVAALARTQALRRRLELLRAGDFAAECARVVAGVDERTSLDDARMAARAAGLDAEAIITAVAHFETHRHIRLCWDQAYKTAGRFPGREPAELVGYAWCGLLSALRHYDPDRAGFSTYACTRIVGAIRDGVRAESELPKRLGTFRRRVGAARDDLTQALGRSPTLAEVAASLDVELAALALEARLGPAASLEELAGDAERDGFEPVDDGPGPDALAELGARAEAVRHALAELPEDVAAAVDLIVMEGKTYAQAARETGVSTRALRARVDAGTELLREQLAAWA